MFVISKHEQLKYNSQSEMLIHRYCAMKTNVCLMCLAPWSHRRRVTHVRGGGRLRPLDVILSAKPKLYETWAGNQAKSVHSPINNSVWEHVPHLDVHIKPC